MVIDGLRQPRGPSKPLSSINYGCGRSVKFESSASYSEDTELFKKL